MYYIQDTCTVCFPISVIICISDSSKKQVKFVSGRGWKNTQSAWVTCIHAGMCKTHHNLGYVFILFIQNILEALVEIKLMFICDECVPQLTLV